MEKRQITNGKFTVNTQNLSDSERARVIKEQQASMKANAEFKLRGDMAQQFNESQEDEELYDGQDPNGL